ncbi:MAG: hypothetical protein ACKVQA_00980 [Burkholderiales bacterium]
MFKPLRGLLYAGVLAACLSAQASWSISPEVYSQLAPEVALELPILEALPVFGWTKREFYFIVENALVDLRYLYREPTGTSSALLSSAIKTFQSSLGHAPTGSLRVNEFVELAQRSNAFWQVPIFPGPFLVIRDDNVISAEGTWVTEGGSEANPVQTSKIRCRKDTSACYMASAKVRMERPGEYWFHAGAADLELHTTDMTITQWEPHRVEAEYRSHFCVTDTLVIDLRGNEARLYRDRTNTETCANVEVTRQTFKLGDGFQAAQDYWDKRQDRAHLLRSRAFQELVKKIQNRAAK